MTPEDQRRYGVLLANGLLVGFPVIAAILVQRWGETDEAVRFFLALSVLNSVGLLDLGTARSVLLKQNQRGSYRDILAVTVVLLGCVYFVLTPISVIDFSLLLFLISAYWSGVLLKAILERDLLLAREVKHRFWSSVSVVGAAVILVWSGWPFAVLTLALSKVVIVLLIGGACVKEFIVRQGFPRVQLWVSAPALLAFAIVLIDRVVVADLSSAEDAARYLFYSLMLQKGLAVFGSILPTYLFPASKKKREWRVPVGFSVLLSAAVLSYAAIFDRITLGSEFWVVILCLAYALNVLTVPAVARNLSHGRHRSLTVAYGVQLGLLVLLLGLIPLSIVSVAMIVFARSVLDFFLQSWIASETGKLLH